VRILQLTTSYPLSLQDGTAPFIRSIASGLAQRGHQVRVLAPERAGAPNHSQDGDVAVDWVRYALHPSLRVIGHAQSLQNDVRLKRAAYVALPLYARAVLSRAHTLCKTWQPHIIHAHWAIPSGVLGALLARQHGLPLVISLHGSDMYLARKSPVYGRLVRWAFGQAKAISACSQNLFDSAIYLGAPLNTTRLIPYGVDIERFTPGLSLAAGPPVILAAGRLVAKKGFDQLIAAAPAIVARCPTAEIWIGGEGDHRPQLEAAWRALPSSVQAHIKFLGQCPWSDMPDLLRQATLFVLPSVRDEAGNEDGLPNILLEGMASGLGIVASDLAGIPSVIHHEDTGLLVRSGDADALVEAVARLLNDSALRTKLGQAARHFAETQLSWRTTAQQFEALMV
jgi:glycosyltransferase involved in cell wall biosynthesis